MSADAQLLHQYVKEGSETAFRELVERHIQLVNATARRVAAGDTHLAEDVTQLVFTDLARKAASLPENVLLGGWLYRHTCFTASKAVRGEQRRRTRERTAMEIHALNEDSTHDAHWLLLAPVLDDALSQLGDEDRDAIVLRYLQQMDVRSIGAALGASENAAQKRLGRALEKLREILTLRGVTVSSVLLATALDAGATTVTVSSNLTATVSTTALSHAAAASTLTSLKIMLTSKLAFGAAATVVAGILITTVIFQGSSPAAPSANYASTANNTNVAQPSTQTPNLVFGTAKIKTSTPAESVAAPSDPFNPFASTSPTGGASAPAPGAASPGGLEDPFAAAPATTPAAPAAAAPAAVATYSNGYADGSTKMPTVTNGQMTMTTTYANGTVSTVPYKEYGATVKISPGPTPHTYVLTFYSESDGKIVAQLNGVHESPEGSMADAAK